MMMALSCWFLDSLSSLMPPPTKTLRLAALVKNAAAGLL
jgi:hypothetical protein